MLFVDRDAMTADEADLNRAATMDMVVNLHYNIFPAVIVEAMPINGCLGSQPMRLQFDCGRYMGYVRGSHVFLGTPVNADSNEEFYFTVALIGDRTVMVDH